MDYLPYIHTAIQYLPYCTSMHVHFVHCEIVDVKHWNITLLKGAILSYDKQSCSCISEFIKLVVKKKRNIVKAFPQLV